MLNVVVSGIILLMVVYADVPCITEGYTSLVVDFDDVKAETLMVMVGSELNQDCLV